MLLGQHKLSISVTTHKQLLQHLKRQAMNSRHLTEYSIKQQSTLYQFILTTDERPTVVYPIPDRISVGYITQYRIYYCQHHIPGSHLGLNIYSWKFLLPGTLTQAQIELAFTHTNHKMPGYTALP